VGADAAWTAAGVFLDPEPRARRHKSPLCRLLPYLTPHPVPSFPPQPPGEIAGVLFKVAKYAASRFNIGGA
jgi:hypothetical protein